MKMPQPDRQQDRQNALIRALELQAAGDVAGAAALFTQILTADPGNAACLYSLGLIELNAGHLQPALDFCQRGVRHAPHFAPLHHLQAGIWLALGQKEAALRCYDAALALEPRSVEILLNSGVLLRSMFRHKEAVERFNQILSIDPMHTAALANCGIVLTEFKQSELAITMFERLIQIQPDYDYALGLLWYERMHICNWQDYDVLRQRILDGVHTGKRVCKTLAFMALSDDAREHQMATHTFAAHYAVAKPQMLWQGERYRHQKIRIAYVSPDLREHPVGHLMAGIFEHHDKSRFETIAISLGIDDQSRLRARMLQAFDKFIDVRDLGSLQAAQIMRELEVDIAIDLGGYTSDTRTEILAYRPAPVQVNYLGYPGTMGVGYFDYILADRHTIPPEHWQFYDEKVVYLPDTYLPTDSSVQIAARTPSRAECGLPDDAIVFCSFSHDYKIAPHIFDIWMSLLKQVPGSVLWLMSRGETAQHNLRREAQVRGVDPARLVFAGRVPLVEDHLARYRQADVFLDTHPYNAHTTAADALMAGLPVVTCMGHSFPSRVAGSLLHACGLGELATHSLPEYAALALRLAQNPELRTSYKNKLAQKNPKISIFDTPGFCRHLEAAYIAMWRQQQLQGSFDELMYQN